MTFKARFARNLICARKRAGLTQEEVAARASLARDTICTSFVGIGDGQYEIDGLPSSEAQTSGE